jgi:phage tail protein X
MAETFTVRGEGLTVDLILWRKYGLRGRSLLEATLDANPGLGKLGPVLPLGTRFNIPDLPAQTTPAVTRVSLFNR